MGTKLWAAIGDKEKRATRLLLLLQRAVMDLIRWLGAERREPGWMPTGRDSIMIGVHYVRPDGVILGPPRTENASDRGSPFSEAIRDYAFAVPETRDEVLKIAALVQQRLCDTPYGEGWLEVNLECALAGTEGGEAGADLIFQARRKLVGTIPEALGWFLKAYGKAWTKKYQEKALESLRTWIQTVHGIELRAVVPRAERRALASRARRELKRARRQPPGSLDVKPAQVVGAELGERAGNVLALGIELINLHYALGKAFDGPRNTWNWVEATGSAMDAYEALAKVSAKVPSLEVSLYRVGSKVVRASPVAIVAGGIDVVTGVRDIVQSELVGQTIGNGMKTTGAIMTVIVLVAPEVPGLQLIAIAGLAMQALGNWTVEYFAPLPTFLRNCEFGQGGVPDSIASAIAPERNDWCKGRLGDLRNSTEAQHRALDQLIHRFEPELEVEKGWLRLRVKMDYPSQISEASFFDAQLGVKLDGERVSVLTLRAGEGFDDEPLLKGEWVALKDLDPPAWRPAGAIAPGHVVVSGWVELDVFGDGSLRVRRAIDGERMALR